MPAVRMPIWNRPADQRFLSTHKPDVPRSTLSWRSLAACQGDVTDQQRDRQAIGARSWSDRRAPVVWCVVMGWMSDAKQGVCSAKQVASRPRH